MENATKGPIDARATYRLQLNAAFPFSAASAIASYLSQLGVSHVYCSPYLQAARGSTHGYDVVNPAAVNPELGGEEGHSLFCQALGDSGLGQLLDFVPNHMSVGDGGNQWWRDVLANGPASPYAAYFDVDWEGGEASNRNRILLPILEDHYGRMLDAGRIRLERHHEQFMVRYQQETYPLSPRTLDELLLRAAEQCGSDELAYIAQGFGALPDAATTDRSLIQQRQRDTRVLQGLLRRLLEADAEAARAVDAGVARVSYDAEALDALLRRQNYRLAYWRTAGEEIDYRRFFDVTSLASLRIEDEMVFRDVHALVLRWVREGVIDGLRIDHIDGLYDPQGYLVRLREWSPRAWLVVEKILAADERLPANWPIQGTTGYEFMNAALGVLMDPRGEQPLTRLYSELTGDAGEWKATLWAKKRLVLKELFASDVNRLVTRFMVICRASRRYRDYTRREIAELIIEAIVRMPVYRTYVRAHDQHVSEEDERRINQTLQCVAEGRPDFDKELLDLLRDVLSLKRHGQDEAEFAMRFQQLTGPAMAKGAEDTAFYGYNRFVALNEVGGDPGRFSAPLATFHEMCAEIQSRHPQTLLATTTHDTKRSEDVRARLAVLSEIPDEWEAAARRWLARSERHASDGMPDVNSLYLLFQNLVGAWPIEEARFSAYMIKAVREAKAQTSWTTPNPAFEEALAEFIKRLYADEAWTGDVAQFVERIRYPGHVNSLAQTLWKLTAPGVPDIYQGQELWDFSLVDPDNRRPVDYERRAALLGQLRELSLAQIKERWHEGLPKLWLIRQALRLRRERPEVFGSEGRYAPLHAEGTYAEHVVAYLRSDVVAVITPRWTRQLHGEWQDTTMTFPAGEWGNVLTRERWSGRVLLQDLMREFPVALLQLEPAD